MANDFKSNDALISVIMPAYNCGPYIGQAIDSILQQTHTNLELLVCDDTSTDNTWSVISSYTDPRIRIFHKSTNTGLLKNFNFLLEKVSGDFVTCQDADDWSETTRLEEQLAVFALHPEVHLVGCNGTFRYSETLAYPCPQFEDGYVTVEREVQPFILPAILYRRSVLDVVPGFHPYFDKATSMDQYFVFNILDRFRGFAISRYLYTARFNPGSNTRNLSNFRKATAHEAYLLLRRQRLETGSDWIIEGKEDKLLAFERSLFDKRSFRGEKYREYAVYRVDSGELREGFRLLIKSFLTNPFSTRLYRTVVYGIRKFVVQHST
jgi:glycosyltransferase involved in cell wall biosynthesis